MDEFLAEVVEPIRATSIANSLEVGWRRRARRVIVQIGNACLDAILLAAVTLDAVVWRQASQIPVDDQPMAGDMERCFWATRSRSSINSSL